MKKVKIMFISLMILLLGMVGKTIFHPFHEVSSIRKTVPDLPELTKDQINRFSKGLRIPTVSNSNYAKTDFMPFRNYINFLRIEYPEIFKNLDFKSIENYGLIFHWKGKTDKNPILFLSHYDVVSPGDPDGWDAGAFSGRIVDSKIYGRGALDMKNMLHGILEATTILLEEGFVPDRDIYFAFGQDEEVGGLDGALKIAKYFKSIGLTFDAVYDEGGIVVQGGSIPGVSSDLALVGVAEKGFLSAKIRVKGLGGHSSMPPLETAIGRAAEIMLRLEKNQFQPRLIPSIKDFLNQVGGGMSFMTRFAIANQWLLEPVLLANFSKNPATNAISRTTTALTMMKGSDGSNVLSPEVEFVVNFRLLPGETIEDVKAHIAKACEGFDTEMEEVSNTRNPSRVSGTDTKAYSKLQESIARIYPDAIISPYVTIGGTDAFKYEIVSDNIYRFNPVLLNGAEQRSIHNQNEYISLDNYQRTIGFFRYLIFNYDN